MTLPPPAAAALARLKRWLLEDAYPIWWDAGADRAGGGFVDRLALDGTPVDRPKRIRVQARQAYAYAMAPGLGWRGPAQAACRQGLDFLRRLKGADGLHHLGAATEVFDGMGELYDQAFVLLALATAKAAFGGDDLEAEAADLRSRLAAFAHPLGGYGEAPGLPAPLFANPNMHLFEAAQAWAAVSANPAWRAMADGLADLALARFIDPASSALAESFERDWAWPAQPVIWPGHLFEWAWLLMRWRPDDTTALAAARRLVDIAETRGVDPVRNVAIFSLDADFAPVDASARLWAQTERIKALALAGSLSGGEDLWNGAARACAGLEAFLAVPAPGLWRDRMLADGAFVDEAAPASSFYHIVCAIAELDRLAAGS